MNYKIIKVTLFALLAGSCASKENLLTTSKYETVYSTTISKETYKTIHKILKENLVDFPLENSKKVNYTKADENYSLRIQLKKSHFKLNYRSNTGYNDTIEEIKSKIETITSQN